MQYEKIKATNTKNPLIIIDNYKKGNKNFIDVLKKITKKNFDLKKFKSEEFGKNFTIYENEGIFLFSLGEKNKEIHIENENYRRIANIIYDIFKLKNKSLDIYFYDKQKVDFFIEGLELSSYEFNKYKSKKDKNILNKINFLNNDINLKNKKVIKEICDTVKYIRDLQNDKGDVITPDYLENLAKKTAKENKFNIEIIKGKDLEKKGLNLIYAVGKGSQYDPRIIIITYNGNPKSKEKIAFVGKGLTYDTGGLNIKPNTSMNEMYLDMSGSAVVLGLAQLVKKLNIKKNIVFTLCIAENAIGSKAFKPGEIIKAYNNKYVEISHTDAEGRLTLADGTSYVCKNYKPSTVINVATLTGGAIVALGFDVASLFANDEKLAKQLLQSSKNTYELCWQLPAWDIYNKLLTKNTEGDLSTISYRMNGSEASPITGAIFVKNFIEKDTKWAHLDIAGPGLYPEKNYYICKNGNGFSLRLLIDFLQNK